MVTWLSIIHHDINKRYDYAHLLWVWQQRWEEWTSQISFPWLIIHEDVKIQNTSLGQWERTCHCHTESLLGTGCDWRFIPDFFIKIWVFCEWTEMSRYISCHNTDPFPEAMLSLEFDRKQDPTTYPICLSIVSAGNKHFPAEEMMHSPNS